MREETLLLGTVEGPICVDVVVAGKTVMTIAHSASGPDKCSITMLVEGFITDKAGMVSIFLTLAEFLATGKGPKERPQ
jgi:hypothetical protein